MLRRGNTMHAAVVAWPWRAPVVGKPVPIGVNGRSSRTTSNGNTARFGVSGALSRLCACTAGAGHDAAQ